MDSVSGGGGSRLQPESQPAPAPHKEDTITTSIPAKQQTDSGSLISERQIASSADEPHQRRGKRPAPSEPPPAVKEGRFYSQEVDRYLEEIVQIFRIKASQGQYEEARQCCQQAIAWMDQYAIKSEYYHIITHCRNGCLFILDIEDYRDDFTDWKPGPEQALYGVNFIRHILLDAGRIYSPDCEFSLDDILKLLVNIGNSRKLKSEYWTVMFKTVADLLQCHEKIDLYGERPEAKHKVALAWLPEPVSKPGELIDYLDKHESEFLKAISENDEVTFDRLTGRLKDFAYDRDFHPFAILEAGSVISFIHERLKDPGLKIPSAIKQSFRNRSLRVINDFGLLFSGTGELQPRDLERSAMALCKWHVPEGKARVILNESLAYLSKTAKKHSSKKDSSKKDSSKKDSSKKDSWDKSVRETFANTYCSIVDRAQDDIGDSLAQGLSYVASMDIRKYLENTRLYPAELCAMRLRLADCYFKTGSGALASELMSKVIDKGIFGIRKAEILASEEMYDKALSTLERVKQSCSKKESDLGLYSTGDVLKLQTNIQQEAVKAGRLPASLYPDIDEMNVTIARLEKNITELKKENRMLDRRVRAKRISVDSELLQVKEVIRKQADKIRDQSILLAQSEAEKKQVAAENKQYRLEVRRLTEELKTLKESHKQAPDVSEAKRYKTLAIQHSAAAEKYKAQRDILKDQVSKIESELRVYEQEIRELKQQIKSMNASVTAQKLDLEKIPACAR